MLVNDIHSQLNSTEVLRISQPESIEDMQSVVRAARKARTIISIAGGRHAMGGQQFGTDTLLIDIRKLSRVLNLDRKRGTIEVEAGIEWPELIEGYLALQNGDGQAWGIAQKQTGADRLTIAGTIAANAHGRGLTMSPLSAMSNPSFLSMLLELLTRAAERKTQNYFGWFTVDMGSLESLLPCDCG